MKVLCLGVNSTWRAGGVNAKVAGSVSEDRSLFGVTDKEGGGSWTGIGRRGRLGICVPVSEQRGQEEKGEAVTKDRNMAVVDFLSQTAVILTKRSSLHPRGVRMESPNFPAALLDLVACGGPRHHSAVVVLSVSMLYSCIAMTLLSVFQMRPPCKYSHLNIRVPLQ